MKINVKNPVEASQIVCLLVAAGFFQRPSSPREAIRSIHLHHTDRTYRYSDRTWADPDFTTIDQLRRHLEASPRSIFDRYLKGEQLQYESGDNRWVTITPATPISVFCVRGIRFRKKPDVLTEEQRIEKALELLGGIMSHTSLSSLPQSPSLMSRIEEIAKVLRG